MDTIIYFVQSALIVIISIKYLDAVLEYKGKTRLYIWLTGFAFYVVASTMWIADVSIVCEAILTILMIVVFCFFYRDWTKILSAVACLSIAIFLSEPIAYFTIELMQECCNNLTISEIVQSSGPIVARIISAFLLYFCVHILRLLFEKIQIPGRYILGSISAPLLSMVLIFSIYEIAVNDGKPIISLLSVILIFSINIMVFRLFIKMTEYYNNLLENQKKLEQLDAFHHQHISLVNRLTGIRQTKHDMNNLLLSLRTAIEGGNVEQAVESINFRLSQLGSSFVSNSGLHTIDSIINYKALIAEKDGIAIHVSHGVTETLNVNWTDIGVILSTALDNAIEACRKNAPADRLINIDISIQNRILMVSVRNFFDGTLLKASSGDFETTKPDREEHGFGLTGIRRLVDKNLGACEIQFENNEFSVSFMIPEAVN